jgi:hypothetical protein
MTKDTQDSPIVEEVRGRAMQVSQRYGHDLHRYCDHLREKQAESRQRLVSQVTVVARPSPKRRNAG